MNENNPKTHRAVNTESMRYNVPGVCNRFWQVHMKFILMCLLVAVSLSVVAFSYSVIRSIRKLEPKTSCIFFCEVENYSAVEQSLEKYSPFVSVYFAVYDETFSPADDDDGKATKYDFSLLGYYMTTYENPPEDILCVVLDASGKIKTTRTYREAGYANGTVLNLSAAEKVLKEATGL